MKRDKILFVFLAFSPLIDFMYTLLRYILKINSDFGINQIIRILFVIIIFFLLQDKKSYIALLSFGALLGAGVLVYRQSGISTSFFADVTYAAKLWSGLVLFMGYGQLIKKKVITEKLIYKAISITSIIILVSIIMGLLGFGLDTYKDTRFGTRGFFNSTNALCITIIILICINWIYAHKHVLCLISTILLTIALFFVGTKTGILGALICIAFFGLYEIMTVPSVKKFCKEHKALFISLSSIVLLLCLGVAAYMLKKYIAVSGRYYNSFYSFLVSNRNLQIDWMKNYAEWKNYSASNVIFGLGYSCVRTYLQSRKKDFSTIEQDYYGIYYLAGIIALAVYISVTVYILYKLLKRIKKDKINRYTLGLGVAYILSIAHAFFAGHVFGEMLTLTYFWLAAAMIVYLDRDKKVTANDINLKRRKYWFANALLFILLKLNFLRKDNIWIYGSWAGSRYDDNSRYLFEYMNREHPQTISIWLSPNQSVVDRVRKDGYLAYNTNSWMGKWSQLRAGYYFYTNGMDDIANVTLVSGAKVIGLWHGTGMKNVYYMSSAQNKVNLRTRLKNIKDKLYCETYQNYAIATSEMAAKMRAATYHLKMSQLLITGQPRNDVLKEHVRPSSVLKNMKHADDYRYILYMPTYRPYENTIIEDFFKEISNNEQLVKVLKNNNIRVILKLHYLTKISKEIVKDPFYIVSNDDIDTTQELLCISDYMITDYSGCCIDFALKNKTILLHSPDFEEYCLKQGLKPEWLDIYRKIGMTTSKAVADKLIELIVSNKHDTYLCDLINEMYESEQIKGTCYSENVYNAVRKIK